MMIMNGGQSGGTEHRGKMGRAKTVRAGWNIEDSDKSYRSKGEIEQPLELEEAVSKHQQSVVLSSHHPSVSPLLTPFIFLLFIISENQREHLDLESLP